ncbi:NACHT and WD repeat domain-containing protein 2 [Geodia barretti]|nr:NACHT and WD repeat domain-containing protein 2 [Geodia barretti]
MDVLEGQLTTDLPKPVSKCIRLFLSSDLTDTSHERRMLKEKVFPHLRSFSRSLGLQLHVVDLYDNLPAGWLPPVASRGEVEEQEGEREGEREGENQTGQEMEGGVGGGSEVMCGLELRGLFQLALSEIRTCQDMSAGPTFISLLGQKYGHKPLPPHIPEEEYALLCGSMEDSADERQLVQQWYQLESNAQPPHYELLQPPQNCNEDWVNTQKVLSTTLRKAAKAALGSDGSRAQK